jgi:NCAIR mutase (PurE)-related protein
MNDPSINADLQREARQGFPEIVFGRGKTPDQVVEAMQILIDAHGYAFATGVGPATAHRLQARLPAAQWDEVSRTARVGQMPAFGGRVAIVAAGTSDLPVAEEAARTCEFLGHDVTRVTDVGVAGIHRLMEKLPLICEAQVIIALAGMEGALPSVLGGLVRQPLIAVPTSVGYGTGLGGIAALLSMLNSCAAGVTVVNIDNGFGAAVAAHRILRALR